MRLLSLFAAALIVLPISIADGCCPPERTTNSDQFLQMQQTFGPQTICTYGCGPNFRQCLYDATGNSLTIDNGCGLTTVQDSFAANFCPPTSVLHPSHDPTKCLEVKDANYADGTHVQVNQCTGQNNQRFIFNPDFTTLIRVAGTGFCISASSSVAGSSVVLRKCDRTDDKQIWVYETFGNIISLYTTIPERNLVLNLPNAQNGQQLNVQTRGQNDNKRWTSNEL